MNTISSSGCFGKFPGAIAGDNPADHVSSFFMTAFVRAPKPKLYFCLFYYEKLLEGQERLCSSCDIIILDR